MRPLTVDEANEVYDILTAAGGAYDSMRADFVHHQTNRVCDEYRFQGSFGFGGKFRRNTGFRLDGVYGGMMYIDYYSEDETEYRKQVKTLINNMLWEIQSKMESNEPPANSH